MRNNKWVSTHLSLRAKALARRGNPGIDHGLWKSFIGCASAGSSNDGEGEQLHKWLYSALGFTLIEILIVIVIIGIAVSVIVLPMGGGGRERKMEEFSRQLTALLRFAHDQAIFESQELGWVLNLADREHHFVRFDEDQTWKTIADDSAFKKRALTPEFQVEVSADGEQIQLPAEKEEGKTEEEQAPPVVFFSSGEMTPFEMRIYSPQVPIEYKILGEMNGVIKLKRGDVEI